MPDTARQIVVIPDLFTSFLATTPNPNPHYGSVRAESEQWLTNRWQCDYKAQKKISAIDFSYFCAILAPKADHDRFRLICDWGNWVFPFDDLFDDGELREDVDRANLLIERLIGAMQDAKEAGPLPAGAEQRLVDCYSNIWERFKSGTENTAMHERFMCAMQDYCQGALQQVQDCSKSHSRDPEDLLTVRRSSIGAQPLYALVEFGHQLDIRKSVLDHPLIEQIRVLGVDLILIQNDILSYRKEEVSPSRLEEPVPDIS
jgi:hypothetical protein